MNLDLSISGNTRVKIRPYNLKVSPTIVKDVSGKMVDITKSRADYIQLATGNEIVTSSASMQVGNTINTNSQYHQLYQSVLAGSPVEKSRAIAVINHLAKQAGLEIASIHGHYEDKCRGKFKNVSVPAINIRLTTPYTCLAALQACKRNGVPDDQPILFEIAKSEMGYTKQDPAQYGALIKLGHLMAGAKNKKIYLQGDHFQVDRKKFWQELGAAGFPGARAKISQQEIKFMENSRLNMSAFEKKAHMAKIHRFIENSSAIKDIEKLCEKAMKAGFRNIDLDSSVLERETGTPYLKQEWNAAVAAYLLSRVRLMEKQMGIKEPIAIGVEVGEVGKANTKPEDIHTFYKIMAEHMDSWQANLVGSSKIALTTGTAHGGVRDPKTGKLLRNIPIRFDIHELFSGIANPFVKDAIRNVTVQHGASTLNSELYKGFSAVGVGEIHLATEYQNIILNIIKEQEPETYQKLLDTLITYEGKHGKLAGQRKAFPYYTSMQKEKYLAHKNTVKLLPSVANNLKIFSSLKAKTYAAVVKGLAEKFSEQFYNLRLEKGDAPLTAAERQMAQEVISDNKKAAKGKVEAGED